MDLEDLEIYQIALKISDLAREIYQTLPREFRFTIGQQFLEASDSPGANIAEGFGRFHYRDSLKFYYNSRASLYEAIYWTGRLQKRNLILPDHLQKMQQYTAEEKIKLNKFIQSLKSVSESTT
ncbi:MAG: four helix bundle protein [Bacteroidota bacterium]